MVVSNGGQKTLRLTFERGRDGGAKWRVAVAKSDPLYRILSKRGMGVSNREGCGLWWPRKPLHLVSQVREGWCQWRGPHHVEGVPFLRAPVGCWFHLVVSIK